MVFSLSELSWIKFGVADLSALSHYPGESLTGTAMHQTAVSCTDEGAKQACSRALIPTFTEGREGVGGRCWFEVVALSRREF